MRSGQAHITTAKEDAVIAKERNPNIHVPNIHVPNIHVLFSDRKWQSDGSRYIRFKRIHSGFN